MCSPVRIECRRLRVKVADFGHFVLVSCGLSIICTDLSFEFVRAEFRIGV